MNDSRRRSHAAERRVDVVSYPGGQVKAVPAGKGPDIVRSQNRGRSGSVLEDGAVQVAVAVAVVGGGLLTAAVLAISALMLGILPVGLLGALGIVAVAALAVAGVVVLRLGGRGNAELLDEAVTLRDAREQWDATPVSAVAESSEGASRRARAHATEGEAG
jgi:hypothetical protein